MSFMTAVNGIFQIIKVVNAIRDLFGGNAGSVITIADLERVVRGEHARFFNTIAFADIATIRNQFYNNWLPSVTRHNQITANDIILPTGSLFLVFQDLIRVKTELSVLLNRVREVFRTYQRELHIDELVDGVIASMHGFALLIHIHGVYAELRRIQIGAASLSDASLLTDTRAAMQYLADAQGALDLFMINSSIQKRRLDMITPLQYFSGSYLFPPSWSFGDSYSPRASTPASNSLYVYVNGNRLTEKVARERRNQHVVNVNNKMGSVFANTANELRAEYNSLHVLLLDRNYAQIGITPGVEPLEQVLLEEEGRISGYDFVITVPVDAEEFVAMSARLRKDAVSDHKENEGKHRRIRAAL